MKVGRSIFIILTVVLTLIVDLILNIFASEIEEFNPSLLILALVGIALVLIIIEIRNPDRNAIDVNFPKMVWLWIACAVYFFSWLSNNRNSKGGKDLRPLFTSVRP